MLIRDDFNPDLFRPGAHFQETAMRGVRADKADLKGAWFFKCDLGNARLWGADLSDAQFINCDLEGASLTNAKIGGATFRNCDLRRAVLAGADMRGAHVTNSDLRGASFAGVNLAGGDLRGSLVAGVYTDRMKGYIIGPSRFDGYRFDLRRKDGAWRVLAGCHSDMTIEEYREHARSYEENEDLPEIEEQLCARSEATFDILDYLEAVAHRTVIGEE